MAGARAKIRAKGGAGAQIISFWLGVHFPPSFRLQANRYIFWQMHNLYILSSEFFFYERSKNWMIPTQFIFNGS